MKKMFNRKGFTLIEISIVLVIIGIILASVMKGRDLIKSSQIKEYNQVFVNQWETIANSYYSRMSMVLDDNTTGGTIDGFMDGTELTNADDAKFIVDTLKSAGIDPCELVKSNVKASSDDNFGCGEGGVDIFKTTIDGEFTGKVTTQIEFTSYTINNKKKNVIAFRDVPYDVGQAIDTMRDGIPDGTIGSILAGKTAVNTATFTPLSWTNPDVDTMVLILEH